MEFAWGLQDLAGTGESHEPSNDGALDHVRSELRGELRSALQLAYLGPQCVPRLMSRVIFLTESPEMSAPWLCRENTQGQRLNAVITSAAEIE